MITVTGRVTPPEGSLVRPFDGHRATLRYRQPLSNAEGEDLSFEAMSSAALDATGGFDLGVFEDGEVLAPITLAIVGPSGKILATKNLTVADLRAALEISASPEAAFAVAPSADPTLGRPVRLSGRIVDDLGRKVPPGLSLTLWGVDRHGGATEPPPRALLITQTQAGGHFSGPWPVDVLARAFVTVSGVSPQPVPLDADGRVLTKVLLVARFDDEILVAACACEASPPRLPDAIDLTTNSAAFSQDLGGRCVDLTVPNRALEEFSYFLVVRTTDPEILPVSPEPSRTLGDGLRDEVAGLLGMPPSTVAALSVGTAKRLLQPTRAVAPEELVHAELSTRIGGLLKEIETFARPRTGRGVLDPDHPVDWDESPTLSEAVTIAHGHILNYRQTWRADGYSLGDLLYSLPLAPGQQRRVAVVDWDRRTRSSRTEALDFEERLDAFLERDRDISEIVGSRLDEEMSGGSRATHWGVAGGVGAGFIGSGFGIFGGVAGGAGGSSNSSWQDSARNLAASSEQMLRDRTLQRASSVRDERSTVIQTVAQGETVRAETEVVANYNHCHAITVEYFEVLRHFVLSQELVDVRECLFVPLPLTAFDARKAQRWRQVLLRYLRRADLRPAFDALERVSVQWQGYDFPLHRYSEEAPETLEGELRISFLLPRPRDDQDQRFHAEEWHWLFGVLWQDALELWTAKLSQATQAERDRVFRTEVAPRIAERMVQRLRFSYLTRTGARVAVPLDATLVSRYEESVPLYVSLRPAGGLPAIPREDIARFEIAYDGDPLPPEAHVVVHAGKMRYRTPHLTYALFDEPRLFDDLRPGDPATVSTPTSWAEERDPRAEDRRAVGELVRHLNDNLEYYHQVIWATMDPNRRYLLLDGVLAPGAGGRSVASVVESRVIGIVGNALVLPVAPGVRLDPLISKAVDADRPGDPPDLLHLYGGVPPPPFRVSVPTRGVYAEAIQGACDSCEAIDDTRFWRWNEELPPDRPTAIAEVSTESRASDEPALTPTALPKPIVNIQQAPALPDPLGLSAALGILAKSDLFPDATGLIGAQKAAAGAFRDALGVAKAMGAKAATLAQANETARTADRSLDQIQRAQSDGLLTPDQANEFTRAVLSNLTGQPAEASKAPSESPGVGKVLDAATQSDKADVSVTTPTEKIDASFSGGPAATAAGVGALGSALGAGVSNAHRDVPELVKLDRIISVGGKAVYEQPIAVGRKTAFVRLFPLGKVGLRAGLIKIDPALAGHVLLPIDLRIVFPEDPAKPGVVDGTGTLPVVVIVHGNHMAWAPTDPNDLSKVHVVPNHEGYAYLQEELAVNGMISVSVGMNVANALGLGLETRSDLIIAALKQLRDIDAGLDPSLAHLKGRFDFNKLALVGHSRGGDAVIQAAVKNRAPSGPRMGIKVVCAISPTDQSGLALKASNRVSLDATHTEMLTLLYGALDGDVDDGSPFRHYDRAQCPKAMVFLDNCCHNRFNSVWSSEAPTDPFTKDDASLIGTDIPRLNLHPLHRDLVKEYVGGLLRWRLNGDAAAKPLFDGSGTNKFGVRAPLQWSHGASLTVLDGFDDPTKNALGGRRTFTIGKVVKFEAAKVSGKTILVHVPHRGATAQIDLQTAPPADVAFTSEFTAPQDWSGFDLLTFRLAGFYDLSLSDADLAQAPLPRTGITIVTGGSSARVDDDQYTTSSVPGRPFRHVVLGGVAVGPMGVPAVLDQTLFRFETIRVPLALFSGISLNAVDKVLVHIQPANGTTLFIDSMLLVKPQ